MRPTTIAVAALVFAASACGGPGSDTESSGLKVVATVSPITNLVENIGGESIELTGLVPEGVDSHTFEPTVSDARLLAEADLIFANGLDLEVKAIRLAKANLKDGAEIVELGSRTITQDQWIFDRSFPREQGDPNPHLWTNPVYARAYAAIIAAELSRRDPVNADAYNARSADLAAKIDQLNLAIRQATTSVPESNRKLVTYHDSFPYFAREYGWTVIAAVQPSDFSEPTASEVAAIIDQVRREQVPAIFGSEVFPSTVLEQIAREAGARYVDDLSDDDLPGDQGDPDHSYLGLMKLNLIKIVEALGGDASPLKDLDTANVAGDHADYRG